MLDFFRNYTCRLASGESDDSCRDCCSKLIVAQLIFATACALRGHQSRIASQEEPTLPEFLNSEEAISHMALEALNEVEPLWTKIIEKGLATLMAELPFKYI